MTKFLKSLALVFLLGTIMTSCTDELDLDVEVPAALLDTYTGSLAYTSSTGDNKENVNGTATISKSGSTYTVTFSDGVPSVSGLLFAESNGAYVTISSSNSKSGMTLEDDKMDIAINSDGSSWAFDGTK